MKRFRSIEEIDKSSLQAARNRHGREGEALVAAWLREHNYHMIEKCEVAFRNGADGKLHARGKVSGDFRAVGLNGQSVLVEVKSHAGSLPYGAFRAHQLTALSEHNAWGGLSLIAWVETTVPGMPRLHVWNWRQIPTEFGKGTSLVQGICGPEIKGRTK